MGWIRVPEKMEIERSSFFVEPEFGKTLQHMKKLKVFCSSTQVYGVPKRIFSAIEAEFNFLVFPVQDTRTERQLLHNYTHDCIQMVSFLLVD